ncbi:uncharacterized protein LOC132066362 [Lycium ferocissimum]|uniref:uncharacterized protein LOC132066362 n=1 Tax=Lycium ferocissimum TaxID=112874 RepID=UPI0028164DB4|nr:uncharacterized protein LOC132066362 [Lycium ferocissimum]
MWRLQNKLKNLAKALSKWSREGIGDVFSTVKDMEEKVKNMEAEYKENETDANKLEMHKAQAEYIKWLKSQNSILRQKARIKLAEEGDTNSKYFYSVIKGRRRRAQIMRIKNAQGIWLENTEDIAQEAVAHFTNIFTQPADSNNIGILDYLDIMVTDQDNEMLQQIPSEEEIKEAIFSMDLQRPAGVGWVQ